MGKPLKVLFVDDSDAGPTCGCCTCRDIPRTPSPTGVLEPGVSLISKPFSQETLARKLRDLLDARPPQAE